MGDRVGFSDGDDRAISTNIAAVQYPNRVDPFQHTDQVAMKKSYVSVSPVRGDSSVDILSSIYTTLGSLGALFGTPGRRIDRRLGESRCSSLEGARLSVFRFVATERFAGVECVFFHPFAGMCDPRAIRGNSLCTR